MSLSEILMLPFFDDCHRELGEELNAWLRAFCPIFKEQHGQEDATCRRIVKELGKAGFLRYVVPKTHGGVHETLDVRSICLIREILARRSSLLDFAFAMQGLGSAAISFFGSEDQKKKYLPKVCKGEAIAAFALSELEAGSDVSAICTTATASKNAYALNGKKSWISNGGIADFYTVFAKTDTSAGSKGISAFIVESSAQGLAVIERPVITSPHPIGTLSFQDCVVTRESLIGEVGEGFKVAMTVLDSFRSTVGAAALGFARRALHEALTHSKGRKVFGQALSEFQLTQDKIADMAVNIDASALLIYRAAWLKDRFQSRISKEASMAKLFATEKAQVVIDKAIQLLGGKGVIADSVTERLYRDIRPLRVYEGTSEIQKIVIAKQVFKDEVGNL